MFPSLALHLAALALCAADVVVRAVRLRLLVPGAPDLSLWRAVTINAYGDAASAVTPARLRRGLAHRRVAACPPARLAQGDARGDAYHAQYDAADRASPRPRGRAAGPCDRRRGAGLLHAVVRSARAADARGCGRRRAGVRGRLRGDAEPRSPRYPAARVARLHADTARRAGRAALRGRGA